MSIQEIPNSGGDYITPVINTHWLKGAKPPVWVEPVFGNVMVNGKPLIINGKPVIANKQQTQ